MATKQLGEVNSPTSKICRGLFIVKNKTTQDITQNICRNSNILYRQVMI